MVSDAIRLFGLLVAAAQLLVPAAAGANEDGPEERYDGLVSGDDPRWIPGVFVGFDAMVQTSDGTNVNEIRESIDGDKTFSSVVVDFGAHLFGPPLDFLPGAPRPFVHGAYQFWPDSDKRIAQEGEPEHRAIPPGEISANTEAESFRGQGTEVSWDVGESWYAGIGLSWLVPIGLLERNLQIRPSLDYFGEIGDARSLLTDVSGPTGGPFTETNLNGSASMTLHGIGPRLQLETYLARRGPIGLSAYAGAQVYWFLGNRDVSFSVSDGASSMDVLVSKDSMVVQGGVGFRLHWLGSSAN
jgi:hypothetical protein